MLGTAISSQGSQYTAEQFVAFVYTSESSYEAIIYYKDEKRFNNALGGGGEASPVWITFSTPSACLGGRWFI